MLEKNDPRLTAYVLGELENDQRAIVETALAESPELQAELDAIREMTEMLARVLPAEAGPELRREQPAAAIATRSPSRRWPAIAALVTAASLLLAVFAFQDRLPWLSTAKYTGLSHNSATTQPATTAPMSPEDAVEMQFAPGPAADAWDNSGTNEFAEDSPGKGRETGNSSTRIDELVTEGMTELQVQSQEESFQRRLSLDLGGAQPGERTIEQEAAEQLADLERMPRSDLLRETNPAESNAARGDRLEPESRYAAPAIRLQNGQDESRPDDPAPDSDFGDADQPARPIRTSRAAPTTTAPRPAPASRPSIGSGIAGRSVRPNEPAEPATGPAAEPAGEQPLGESAHPTSSPEPGDDKPADDAPVVARVVASTSSASGEASKPAKPAGDEQGVASGRVVSDRESREKDNKNEETGKDGRFDGEKASQPATRTATTWRRAAATPNASRLMVGDQDDLPLEGMQINVMVDGFRARVLMDLYFFNHYDRQLEGAFKLRLPNEGSLYYFAFGQTSFEYRPMIDSLATKGFLTPELVRASGTGPREIFQARTATWQDVKEARVVPKEKAAHAYSEVVRRRVDPALVEWSGAGVFNAHVYPLQPKKLHRIVVGYDVNLTQDGDDLTFALELPEYTAKVQTAIDLDVSALPGATAEVAPATRPFVSGGRAFYHFDNPAQRSIDVRLKTPGTVVLSGQDENAGRYFAARFTPDLPSGETDSRAARAVFLVDTSLSSNPDKFNVWLKLLEAVLEKNRDSVKEFAVLFFNIESHWWHDGFSENTPENVRKLLTDCTALSLEGATDLRQALAEAAAPSWAAKESKESKEAEKPAATDLFLLSDGAATWGETDILAIAAAVPTDYAGGLFAYKSGLTGTAIHELETLARERGGAVFSVANEAEVEQAATAHRARPWRLLNIAADGASDLLVAGRPQFLYPGQPLWLVGRGQPQGAVQVHVRRGDDDRVLTVPVDRVVDSDLVARAYGQIAVGQLEDLASATENVSVAYARHFRVPGQTCSLLMLDSEADYQRFNIKPEDDAFVVKSSEADSLIRQKSDELATQRTDPKAAVQAWLAKLQQTPGVQFQIPTSLQLVVDRLPKSAFEVAVPRLICKQHGRAELSKTVFEQLASDKLKYDVITAEANRRFEKLGAPDALKALSSLIENNPGDPVLTRDVAFTAMGWGLGGQAYPLLKRVAYARPYEPQVYQAIGQCLADLGAADLAMIHYEVALHGQWHSRYQDLSQIAAVEYLHLLHRIAAGELRSQAPDYAKARLESLLPNYPAVGDADLIVTMMWNTDRTDVDLHVLEPSGEECFYKNRNTRAGGQVTRDVTEGLGPEMYTLHRAPAGDYKVFANYFASDTNRTQVRSKVYVTIYEKFGSKHERVTQHAITLSENSEKREIATVKIAK